MAKLTPCHTGCPARHHHGMQQFLEQLINGVFSRPPQAQTGQRDAGLRQREQPRRIGQQIQRGLRTGLTFLGQRTQAAFAHRNQRHFGGGEEAVQQQHGGQNDEAIGHRQSKTTALKQRYARIVPVRPSKGL